MPKILPSREASSRADVKPYARNTYGETLGNGNSQTRYKSTKTSSQTRILAKERDDLALHPVTYERVKVEKEISAARWELQKLNMDLKTDPIEPAPLEFLIDTQEHSFTVLHGDSLPPLPGKPTTQDKRRTRSIEPELLVGCYWSINAIPYTGFLPCDAYRVCFNDPLFSCVFQRKWEIPIQPTADGAWQLDPRTIEQWRMLERILLTLRDILSHLVGGRSSQQHLPAPAPSNYLYHCHLAEPIVLHKRLIRSRWAFVLLGAEISYLYAPVSLKPPLLDDFEQELWLAFPDDDVAVQDIRQCWIFVPSTGFYKSASAGGYNKTDGRTCVPRFGLFVNTQTTDISRGFLHYECFRVPVWFWWGGRLRTLTPSDAFILRRYGFHRDTVKTYLAMDVRPLEALQAGMYFEKARYSGGFHHPFSRAKQLITDTSEFAPLNHESWSEFFVRRERTILGLIVPSLKEAIIHDRQQKANLEGFQPPSRVFRWEKARGPGAGSDLSHGVRVLVGAHKAGRVWGEYLPGQRVYCSTYDEWDLCEEFSLGEEPPIQDVCSLDAMLEDVGSGGGATDDSVEFAGPDPSTAVELDSAKVGAEFDPLLPEDGEISEDSAALFSHCEYRRLFAFDPPVLQTRDIDVLTFGGILTQLHGLQMPSSFFLHASSAAALSLASPSGHYSRCRRLLACGYGLHDPNYSLSDAVLQDLEVYLGHCKQYNGPVDSPPTIALARFCDVSLPQASPLRPEVLNKTIISKLSYAFREENVYQSVYQIVMVDCPALDSLRILVFRAMHVLFFLRQISTRTPEEGLLMLTRLGIRFSLAIKAVGCRLERPLPMSVVPTRRYPFQPTVYDYQQYVARRTALLTHTSVLRAALMAGRIFWRLAREHVEDPSIILTGPGRKVEATGQRSTLSSGLILCEEQLTDDQIDILCGVYRVVDDRYPDAPAYVSWFPRQGGWRASGFNVGMWTEDSESWYQARVKSYLKAEKGPLKQKDWDRSLRLNREAKKVAHGLEVFCAEKLAPYLHT